MKKKIGLIILSVALVATMGIGARTVNEWVQVVIARNINVNLNGETQTLRAGTGEVIHPIIYDGSSYLPVRAIADLAGLNVDWDAESGTVLLDEVIIFNNKRIEDIIRNAIDAPVGNITKKDLSEIRTLDLSGPTKKFLPVEYIGDISVLSNLTNLEVLNLSYNKIIDISVLSNLTNLKVLNLKLNNITDISPLSNLTNLEVLNLDFNKIIDISPLSELTNLKTLDLTSNNITDITPLANLINLECLYLSRNNITDISPLFNLTSLEKLWLLGNRITSISALSYLTNLRVLWLNHFNITDFSPLDNLPHINRADYE